jgi:hypothetical protein
MCGWLLILTSYKVLHALIEASLKVAELNQNASMLILFIAVWSCRKNLREIIIVIVAIVAVDVIAGRIIHFIAVVNCVCGPGVAFHGSRSNSRFLRA